MENLIIQSLIKASPKRLWKALTDKEEMKNWYFNIPDFKLELHHQFNFYEPGGKNKFHHQCEITQIVEKEKFQHTWAFPEFSSNKTLVSWELSPTEDGTQLQLTHSGLESFSDLGNDFSIKNFRDGWESIINQSLKTFLEKNR